MSQYRPGRMAVERDRLNPWLVVVLVIAVRFMALVLRWRRHRAWDRYYDRHFGGF